MNIQPKLLIREIKAELERLRAGANRLPRTPEGDTVALQLRALDILQVREALEGAASTLEFVGAALGDAELLARVLAWPMPAHLEEALQAAIAGRDPAPIVPEGAVRGADGILRLVTE